MEQEVNNLLLQEVCVKKGNALPMEQEVNNLLLQEVIYRERSGARGYLC